MDEVCSIAWSKICWNDGLRVMLWTNTRWSTRSFHSLNHSSKGLVSLVAQRCDGAHFTKQSKSPNEMRQSRIRSQRSKCSQCTGTARHDFKYPKLSVANLLSIHKQREHLWKTCHAIVKSPKLQAFLHDRSSAVIQEHGHALPPYPMKR